MKGLSPLLLHLFPRVSWFLVLKPLLLGGSMADPEAEETWREEGDPDHQRPEHIALVNDVENELVCGDT